MDDIVHTFGVPVFRNASCNHEVDGIIRLQNHRYRSFPELHLNLPAKIFPSHKKQVFPNHLYIPEVSIQTDEPILPFSELEFDEILNKPFLQFQ